MPHLPISYILPLKVQGGENLDDLESYLCWLSQAVAEVIVVDGSTSAVFARNNQRWHRWVTHCRPDPRLTYLNKKVAGVETGISRAKYETIIVADDDVRYTRAGLDIVRTRLSECELVRPHNYFAPRPWHAVWDTGRTLINLAVSGDYPGTLAIRSSTFRRIGGYDGDVLFENLELIRTVEAAGGRVVTPLDLFVARRPPTARHFLSQRTRQAFDDFALPVRLAVSLSLAPVFAATAMRHLRIAALLGAGLPVLIAERGRRRGEARRYYPFICSLCAPAWVTERAITSWVAVYQRLFHGGTRYGDAVIRRAATSRTTLKRRHGARPASAVAALPVTPKASEAVHRRLL